MDNEQELAELEKLILEHHVKNTSNCEGMLTRKACVRYLSQAIHQHYTKRVKLEAMTDSDVEKWSAENSLQADQKKVEG